jgi:hypothetical protein
MKISKGEIVENPMSNQEIDELLALEAKASAGPWEGLLRSKTDSFRIGDDDRQFMYVMREHARELLMEVKRLRAALAEAEAKPSTEEIIEACGGDWVLEAWDEKYPEDFVLAVMRAMKDEVQRWRKEAKRLATITSERTNQ